MQTLVLHSYDIFVAFLQTDLLPRLSYPITRSILIGEIPKNIKIPTSSSLVIVYDWKAEL